VTEVTGDTILTIREVNKIWSQKKQDAGLWLGGNVSDGVKINKRIWNKKRNILSNFSLIQNEGNVSSVAIKPMEFFDAHMLGRKRQEINTRR